MSYINLMDYGWVMNIIIGWIEYLVVDFVNIILFIELFVLYDFSFIYKCKYCISL